MDDLPTRDRLVFAAMKLFGEKGYLSTSVQAVIKGLIIVVAVLLQQRFAARNSRT